MSDELYGRRCLVPIYLSTLANILSRRLEIAEGWPDDSRIVGVQQISMFETVELVVESASFRELTPGEMLERKSPLLRDRCDANAELMMASPLLLKELEHICGEAESWHWMHHAQNLIQCDSICKAIPGMRAAIAKARGVAALSRQPARMPKLKRPLTLDDCAVPIPLRCMHCEHRLPKISRIEAFDKYVVVDCPRCHCMTPFNLEKTA